MSEIHYKSNAELKRMERQVKQAEYLEKQRISKIEERWNDAQVKAASAQSVIDYAVEQYEAHKDELAPDIVAQVEAQIAERRKQIEEYIMAEKEVYLEGIGLQSD